ncbi:hypothetical protein Aph01nite_77420 [Acrocarpospora phusangensis]|uniref:Dynamin N-terminal domain-containing protein n=1 Tax=Acrocarpospora phusangensis TaxID=1070424 RepID=A0A919USN7_9ACTN|nr:dynamin family protein [Acrocarpospora phusangensis]GIH29432.1 hypothetical protein Aph01nite_77420 [Acrocarpospora phusangensis]
MLEEITRRADQLLPECAGNGVRDSFQAAVEPLRRTEATIVFGGRFSSGKSSLINALIGRALLPTDDYPETGVPCWIQSGSRDQAFSYNGRKRRLLAFSTSAIARQVSLVDSSGDYRDEVHRVERILLTLASSSIPPDVTWVDSPGIDDTAAMNARATEAASAADLLVWVVNSRQPMSETEQAFLNDHMAQFGTSKVLFVVNVFLGQDTPEYWRRFLAERAEPIRTRITSVFGHRPQVVFVSARACAGDPAAYGGPQARHLLDSLSPRVLTARLEHAAFGVRGVAEEMEDRVRRHQSALEHRRDQIARERAKFNERERGFRRALNQAVSACFARHREEIERCGPQIEAQIESNFLYNTAYGSLLTGKLRDAADRLADDLVAAANECARENKYRALPAAAVKRLKDSLRPPDVTVPVSNTDVRLGKGGAGAAIGATVGTFLFPGVGTVVGGVLGGLIGGGKGINDSIRVDREATKASARTAGRDAAARLMARQEEVRQLILASCTPSGQAPADPDETPLLSARTLRFKLHELARDCLAEAERRMVS